MIGQFGIPGQTAAYNTVDNEFIWGGSANQVEILLDGGVIDNTARDAGATPTTKLRKGLLLGKVAATGKLKQFDPTATDGTQDVYGILGVEVQMTDMLGNAQDRQAPVIVKAPVRPRQLFILGAAFVGSAHEYLARYEMSLQGFKFDDDLAGRLAGTATVFDTKTASYTCCLLTTERRSSRPPRTPRSHCQQSAKACGSSSCEPATTTWLWPVQKATT